MDGERKKERKRDEKSRVHFRFTWASGIIRASQKTRPSSVQILLLALDSIGNTDFSEVAIDLQINC